MRHNVNKPIELMIHKTTNVTMSVWLKIGLTD